MMTQTIRRVARLAIAVVLALTVIVPMQLTIAPGASPAVAADGSRFDPGNIISDRNFYDGNAMSAAEVQSFLEGRVRVCDYSRAQLPCLRDYTQATPTMAATLRCAPYQGSASERASDIIAKVGAACGISQKTLLVLLQKEQSLVDDTWPYVSQYAHATGYNCPDTAPCDPTVAGFFYQVYWAAYSFQAYKANGGGPNYKVFRVNTINWHPNASCGSSDVYIANYATAGLYNYTPYRPNDAALANLYGSGDSCSSYGNRNFWRLWTDWFGSPTESTPFGWLETASLSGSVLTAKGWAVDPDSPPTALQVQLVVDGAVVTAGAANVVQAGLGAAIAASAPGAGDNHGYSLSATLSVGTHTVCVTAVDDAGGANARLLYGGPGASDNCATVTISRAPFGWLDSVSLTGSVLTAKGWTIDPDTTTVPLQVQLVVDGAVVTTGIANSTRPGLAAAIAPGAGDDHGFSLETNLSIGMHRICVIASNTASGPNTTLSYGGVGAASNCATVTNGSSAPFGWMDSVELSGQTMTAKGWAIDPDVPATSIQVQLVVDGAVVSSGTANAPKPGLGAAVTADAPGAGDSHAYSLSTTLAAGTHTVCVVATNNAAGPNTTLRFGGPGASNNCATLTYRVNPPFGWLDSATFDGSVVTAKGWAIDSNTASAPIQVQLVVDGSVVRTGTAGLSMPGLGAAMAAEAPGAGDNHGFSLSASLSVGDHIVCVVALDDAGGPNARLLYGGPGASNNCATVTVSRAPFGWMDAATLSGSVLTSTGWAIDPDAPSAAIQVQLVVDGSVVTTRTANEPKPGLGAAMAGEAPGAGDSHGYSLSTTLSVGTHTVCVVAMNTGPGPNGTLRYSGAGASNNCAIVTPARTAASPFGWMDSATLSGAVLAVKGWAIDPDTAAAPIQVQLVVDGAVVTTATANGSKPGLGAAMVHDAPGSGDNHGFTLSATLSAGTHRVCVVAVDSGGGASSTLLYGGPGASNNCATVSYGVNTPFGWLETASLSGSVLTAKGWAVDPDAPPTALQVQLVVDGAVVTAGAASVTQAGLGAAIAAGAPGAGDNHGYSLSATLSVGTHTVCVTAVDDAGGANARLLYGGPGASDNCATVTVSRAPFGWLDSASLTGSVLTAKGWAIDPDTISTALQVQLVVDGAVVTTGTANAMRPGLAAAVAPGAGDDHGYSLETTLSAGTHTVCVVAMNSTPGPDTTLLYGGPGAVGNCATVTYGG